MKALSIKQPYASLIAMGIKDVENRSRRTLYRGRILIHAPASLHIRMKSGHLANILTDEQMLKMHLNKFRSMLDRSGNIDKGIITSAIIGEVDIVDCISNSNSVWAEENSYHWILENAHLYDEPILNIKGKLGLWEY